jgi:hypothetical protein
MATPKSANERLRRKLRVKKKGVKDKNISSKVQKKKSADNDPRPLKDKLAEDFVRFYKTGECVNPRISRLVDTLIDISIELKGENKSFPFRLNRLVELKEQLSR